MPGPASGRELGSALSSPYRSSAGRCGPSTSPRSRERRTRPQIAHLQASDLAHPHAPQRCHDGQQPRAVCRQRRGPRSGLLLSSPPSRAHSGTVHQLEAVSHRPALPSARPASVLLGTALSGMQARRRDPSSQRVTAGIRPVRPVATHGEPGEQMRASRGCSAPGTTRPGAERLTLVPDPRPGAILEASATDPARERQRASRPVTEGPTLVPARAVSTPIAPASDSRHPSQTPVAHGPSVER